MERTTIRGERRVHGRWRGVRPSSPHPPPPCHPLRRRRTVLPPPRAAVPLMPPARLPTAGSGRPTSSRCWSRPRHLAGGASGEPRRPDAALRGAADASDAAAAAASGTVAASAAAVAAHGDGVRRLPACFPASTPLRGGVAAAWEAGCGGDLDGGVRPLSARMSVLSIPHEAAAPRAAAPRAAAAVAKAAAMAAATATAASASASALAELGVRGWARRPPYDNVHPSRVRARPPPEAFISEGNV